MTVSGRELYYRQARNNKSFSSARHPSMTNTALAGPLLVLTSDLESIWRRNFLRLIPVIVSGILHGTAILVVVPTFRLDISNILPAIVYIRFVVFGIVVIERSFVAGGIAVIVEALVTFGLILDTGGTEYNQSR